MAAGSVTIQCFSITLHSSAADYCLIISNYITIIMKNISHRDEMFFFQHPLCHDECEEGGMEKRRQKSTKRQWRLGALINRNTLI